MKASFSYNGGDFFCSFLTQITGSPDNVPNLNTDNKLFLPGSIVTWYSVIGSCCKHHFALCWLHTYRSLQMRGMNGFST